MTKSLQEHDRNFDAPKVDGDITWHNALALTIAGQGWPAESQPYTRLPDRAEGVVRKPVWDLSRACAGVYASFETNSAALWARYTLRFPTLAMAHMPAVGVSGVDLYHHSGDKWLWGGANAPSTFPEVSCMLVNGTLQEQREYRLYLPLYNGIESLEIGVQTGTSISAAPPASHKPIVMYGTSIVQGGCASRAGMVHTSILGRRLNLPVINLGFSGNGQAEPEVAQLLSELDASVFVIDCLPNLGAEQVKERIPGFLERIREAHPTVPIVLVEHVPFQNQALMHHNRDRVAQMNRDLREIFESRAGAGDANLHYIPNDTLWGDDTEATVDAIHATDLGFLRMAEAMEPVLSRLL